MEKVSTTPISVPLNAPAWSSRAAVPLTVWLVGYFTITIAHTLWRDRLGHQIFGIASTLTQTVLDLLIAGLFTRMTAQQLPALFDRVLLVSAFIAAALADATYGSVVNILGIVDTRGTRLELLYNIPFNIFLSATAVLMGRLAIANRVSLSRLAMSAFVATVALHYFYFSTLGSHSLGYQTIALTSWSLCAEALIIVNAGFFFLFATTAPAQLISSGLLIICSVNFFLQYLEVSGNLVPAIPFEALWVLGQLSVLIGAWQALKPESQSTPVFALDLRNSRARFIVSLVVLIAALHACWQLFFLAIPQDTQIFQRFFLFAIFLSLALTPLTLLFKSLFIKPTLNILETIHRTNDDASTINHLDADLRNAATSVIERITAAEKDKAQNEALGELARQVAHDIRSPLGALNSITEELSSLPEGPRNVVRASISRIAEIADSLLASGRASATKPLDKDAVDALYASQSVAELLAGVIAEKQSEFAKLERVAIVSDLDSSSYSVFARLDPTEFRRSISNLINNAVEAIEQSGSVRIGLARSADACRVVISDTGRGIPPEAMATVGDKGVTLGKSGGHGLGLYYAREAIARWGGRLDITSTVGEGTVVTATLPVTAPAPWFVESLVLPNAGIVCLDDDEAIHQLWKYRFAEYGLPMTHLYDGNELLSHVNRKGAASLTDQLFLIDYELRNQSYNGEELIRLLGIKRRSVLVTSSANDGRLLRRWGSAGIKTLPKNLAGIVPVRIG